VRALTRRVRRLEDAAVDDRDDLVEAPPPRPEFVAALAELCGQAPEDVARSLAEHPRPRRPAAPLTEEMHRMLLERCRMGPDGQPQEGW
jgi:hypothetical protein